jgi:sigma-E factor negative regulatory protein RseC
LLARHVGRKLTRFRIENTLDAKVGDEVVVGLSEQAMLRGSLLVYLFPLLSMLLAALVVDAALAEDLSGRDLLVSLAAFTGLGLAVLALRSKLAGAQSQQQLTPVAVRKKLSVT